MKTHKGFTLIELMIVMCIIAIFASVILTKCQSLPKVSSSELKAAQKGAQLITPTPVPATPPK